MEGLERESFEVDNMLYYLFVSSVFSCMLGNEL